MSSKPKVIYDSRKGKGLYENYDFYRSSDFEVPQGKIAVLELTTAADSWEDVSFSVIRAAGLLDGEDCYSEHGAKKHYHQNYCDIDLGDPNLVINGSATQYTEFNKSLVRLGWDAINGKVHQRQFIIYAGTYTLIANKDENPVLDICDKPTIVEVSIMDATFNIHVATTGC